MSEIDPGIVATSRGITGKASAAWYATRCAELYNAGRALSIVKKFAQLACLEPVIPNAAVFQAEGGISRASPQNKNSN